MPWRNRPNRSDEYRRRAAEARAKAETLWDLAARDSMLRAAETWEHMAGYDDLSAAVGSGVVAAAS